MIARILLLALSPLWAGLEPGPHEVGYERLSLRDYSRPFRGKGEEDRARVIRVSIWYPARETTDAEPVPFAHYVDSDVATLALWLRASGYRWSDDEVETFTGTPTAAFAGAARATGTYPLLLFGTGLTAPTYLNSVLCEYLASHGYVSVALPSLPYRENVEPGYDDLTIETHLRDLELVIHEMRDYPGVDIERLGLLAWGIGGVSQLLLQMKNPDVAAVVSLDAGAGYRYGRRLLGSSLYYDPTRTAAWFLHATGSGETSAYTSKSLEYYDSIHRGPAFLLTFEGATHAEFTSLATVVPHDGSFAARERYRILSEYVRRFLDLAIGGEPDAAAFFAVAPSRHGFEGVVLSKRR